MNVSAIIVTRGDVDLTPILDSFGVPECSPIKETIIWDNSEREDLAVYGRYAAIADAKHDLIFTQDDDCVLPPESIQALIDRWLQVDATLTAALSQDLGSRLVANMPAAFRHSFYEEHCLVGFGAVFQRDLPGRAFDKYWNSIGPQDEGHQSDLWWERTCDIVFTALTPRVLLDLPYENLPWAEDETRMYRQNGHVAERTRMLELVRKVRDGT